MTSELSVLTLAESARLVEARSVSPLELARACLQRIEAFDGGINAFNTLTAERALADARRAGREIAGGHYRGPLHGIPFALKDIYDTAGIATTGYSRVFLDRVPARDAAVVGTLLERGAVLTGKLATHELANGGPSFDLPWPPARNPWNPECFTGGSSTGAAAAVAAGFVPFAMGTDTGGSIRIPAAMCGVAGLKPTYGLVSRAGVMPHSHSLDTCGPIAWTVEDCAIVLEAIAGYDPNDPGSVDAPPRRYRDALTEDLRGLRIGVLRHFWEDDLVAHPDVCAAMERALDVFRDLGAKVETVRVQPLQRYYDVKNLVSKPEVFAVHQANLVARLEDFGSDFLGLTLPGCLFDAPDHVHAQNERRRLTASMSALFDHHDVLVTAASGPAPLLAALSASRVIDHWTRPNFETAFSVTGVPALALCNGYTGGGLPLGMQIAARHFDEATVLRAGHAYERATAWRAARPPLVARAQPIGVEAPAVRVAAPECDSAITDFVSGKVRRAGLRLSDTRLAQLCAIAPFAIAAASRVREQALGRQRHA